MQQFFLDRFAAPPGDLLLVFDAEGRLRALDFVTHEERMQRLLRLHYGAVTLVERTAPEGIREPLERYFGGELDALDAVPTATGGTAFQRDVWTALRRIPAGTTQSYGQLAAAIGRPAAVRAVGLANGANPLGIVVPCHRVIGQNARLTGYGGGLERKRWLLAHEGATFRD